MNPTAAPEQVLRLGRNYVRLGDPLRWRGHRGLFRFCGLDAEATEDKPAVAVLFGPASSAKPKQRYVRATELVRVRPTEALRAIVAARPSGGDTSTR